MQPLASSTGKVKGNLLLAFMSRPNRQKNSAGLEEKHRRPDLDRLDFHFGSRMLRQDRLQHDNFLRKGPFGRADFLGVFLHDFQAPLHPLRTGPPAGD